MRHSTARSTLRTAALAALSLARCASEADTAPPTPAGNGDGGCVGVACVRVGQCRPGEASAQFRTMRPLPTSVLPSARVPVEVTYTNCSGVDWTREGFALLPTDPEVGLAWGVRRVALPVDVPQGAEVTFRFELQAPLTAGNFTLQWAVERERVERYQEPTPAAPVIVQTPADCSEAGAPVRFRTQIAPPDFIATGDTVRARVTFANCTPAPLTRGDGWTLVSRADPDTTWGTREVPLPNEVPAGAEVSFDLVMRAPTTPGRYPWAWQVAQRGTPVGEASPTLRPTVLTPADCDRAGPAARAVRQETPPGTVDPNQSITASVTWANCGDRAWGDSVHLDAAAPAVHGQWGVDTVDLPLPVGPGFQIDVPFRARAPGAPGRYTWRWGLYDGARTIPDAAQAYDITVRCIPQCAGRQCGGDSCGGSCGSCSDGYTCDGSRCQAPDRPSCNELQWWNSYITYEHISSGWHDTDLGIAAGTRVQLRHTSRLERTGVYGWGYMPEFTDLVTGARFRLLHLKPQNQWATDVGRVYPAGYVVGLSGGNTYDTGYPRYSTGSHLCVQTLRTYRSAFPSGRDACR